MANNGGKKSRYITQGYRSGLLKGAGAFLAGYAYFPISKAAQGKQLSIKAAPPYYGFDSFLFPAAFGTIALGLGLSAAADGVRPDSLAYWPRSGLRILGTTLSAMAGFFLAQNQIDPPDGPINPASFVNQYSNWIPYRASSITYPTSVPGPYAVKDVATQTTRYANFF